MKAYFKLQVKLTQRKFNDLGFHPLVSGVLIIALFLALSLLLFSKTSYAPFVYLVFSASLVLRLSESKRNDFLKLNFSLSNYKLLRLLENLSASLPFALFLIYKGEWFFIFPLIVLHVILSFYISKSRFNFSIPIPFGKYPFEFTIGFRKTLLLFPLAYILSVIAYNANNYYLGIFSLLLVFVIALSYYAQPENEFYVWMFKANPRRFLWTKIKIAFSYISVLHLPITIFLAFTYPQLIAWTLLFLLGAYLVLAMVILAKYTAYPNEMSTSHAFLMAFGIAFPPLLLFLLVYFYYQSKQQLKTYLND